MKTKLEVVIIGAGPAGALTAYLLSLQGHKVRVFEKNNYPIKNKICGEYLCPAGDKLLADLNLQSLLINYPKIYGMNLYSPNQQHVSTHFPNAQYGHALKREIFDNELIKLAQSKGAEFHFGVHIQSLQQKENKILVTDGIKSWETSYVVGAEGRQSLVGKWLDLRKKSESKRVAIHTYLKVKPGVKYNQGEMHILSDGSYCGLNPVNDSFWNFSLVCDAGKIMKYKSTEKLVREAISESKRMREIFDLDSAPWEPKISGKITNPMKKLGSKTKQAVLVGDAAGFVDPLTGEGIYHALLTAKVFSQCMKNHENFDLALDNYETIIQKGYRKKEIVNYFFQWLIHRPILCNLIAHFLKSRPVVRNTFIGLIGNVYTPLESIKIIFFNIFNKKGIANYVDHY